MNYKEREHALDEARDAFTRAASALTLGNRIHNRTYLASAILEGAYGLMRLSQADSDERGHDEAVAYLKEMRKSA